MTEPVAPGPQTILVVDDQEDLAFMLSSALEREGFAVLVAASGEEAVRIALGHAGPVDLLVTDVVMPGMNGRALAEAIRTLHPDLQVIFMSGFEYQILFPRGQVNPDIAFLAKPFPISTLVQQVRQLLKLSQTEHLQP